MIGRTILAALLAGMLAGLIMSGIQYARLTPLIVAAEKFEKPEAACVENMPGMKVCDDNAFDKIAETINRTGLTSIVAGAGFALLLAGISLISGLPITPQNGLIWGICGFLAVSLAPAAGLPPELPGMPIADLNARQIWWVFTVIATGLGIWLIATKPFPWAALVAIAVIALPHLFGAPQAASHESDVPAALAATFAANSLSANAIMWALIGVFLGHAFAYTERKQP